MDAKLKIGDNLKQSGFYGFDHNTRCYRCRKFYGRCNGMSGKLNVPCKRFIKENDTEKIKYTLGKEAMYKMGKLYDGKKCGVIVIAGKVEDEGVVAVYDYKKVYTDTFEGVMDATQKLRLNNPLSNMIFYLSSDGKELALNQGRNEMLFVKSDRDVTKKFQRVGLDVLSI